MYLEEKNYKINNPYVIHFTIPNLWRKMQKRSNKFCSGVRDDVRLRTIWRKGKKLENRWMDGRSRVVCIWLMKEENRWKSVTAFEA